MDTSVVYDYTNLSGLTIYDKLLNGSQPRNYVYVITASSNLNLSRICLTNTISCDIYKFNSSGVSNCYDKININTNYDGKIPIDSLLATPIIYDGGCAGSTGTINRSSGSYTFTVNTQGHVYIKLYIMCQWLVISIQ